MSDQPRFMPGRVGKACKACSSNHLRCSDEKPCRRCQEKGIECKWNDPMELDAEYASSEDQQQDDSMFSQDNGSSSMAGFPEQNSIGSTSASSVMGQQSLDILTPQTTQSLFQNLGRSSRSSYLSCQADDGQRSILESRNRPSLLPVP